MANPEITETNKLGCSTCDYCAVCIICIPESSLAGTVGLGTLTKYF